jgi:hypothetical protein
VVVVVVVVVRGEFDALWFLMVVVGRFVVFGVVVIVVAGAVLVLVGD